MRYGNKTRSGSQVSGWLNGIQGKPWYESFGPPISVGLASITADATPHTKGAWVELVASNASNADTASIRFTAFDVSNTFTEGLCDIGIGASGSEVAVIENVPVGGASLPGILHTLPIKIPAGSRICARFQSVRISATGTVRIVTHNNGAYDSAPTSLVAVGANTATSTGVTINAGTYTQITASTSQAFSAVHLALGLFSNGTGIRSMIFTLATGASSSEVAIQEVAYRTLSTAEQVASGQDASTPVKGPIPAGTRLSAKQVEEASLSLQSLTAVVLGVPT